MRNKKKATAKRNSNSRSIQHVEVNKLPLPHKKIKYCPIISQILKKNNKKFKNPIIFSCVEFMNLYEKINIRLVCKQWNEAVIQNLPFLKNKENFINCVMNKTSVNNYMNRGNNISLNQSVNNHVQGSYRKTNRKSISNLSYQENNNNYANQHQQYSQTNENLFNYSDQKFSRKKVLVRLINSKNFNTIKNKVSLGEMTKSRVLSDD